MVNQLEKLPSTVVKHHKFITVLLENYYQLLSTGKLLTLTALSHLKTTHQKCIKALLYMNSNALDVTLTTSEKLIAVCTPE